MVYNGVGINTVIYGKNIVLTAAGVKFGTSAVLDTKRQTVLFVVA